MGDPWARIPSEFLTVDEEKPVDGPQADVLRVWLRRRLGAGLRRLTQRVGGGGGHKSAVYFADTDSGPLVIRAPKRGTGWSAPLVGCSEYHSLAGLYAIGRLSQLGQPVPDVLALEQDCGVLGAPFAVFRRVPGLHMTDYCEQWTNWPYPEEQWGEFLSACHSVEPIRGAGPVNDGGVGWSSSWSDYISRLLSAYVRQYRGRLPADFGARWGVLLERLGPQLDARPVRLLQLESNGYCNLILDPTTHRINAVLDFEEVTAGDPLFELVVMAWYLGRRGIADHGGRTCFRWGRFYRTYGRVDWGHPLVPVYRAVILLEKLWRPDSDGRAKRLVAMLERLAAAEELDDVRS
jgi:aminoglycoside phosphotransferase (APT) family kinase protein